MAGFSLTSLLVEKLACQIFNKEISQGKTWHISPSTRENKTCQGENVLVWTALFSCVVSFLSDELGHYGHGDQDHSCVRDISAELR